MLSLGALSPTDAGYSQVTLFTLRIGLLLLLSYLVFTAPILGIDTKKTTDSEALAPRVSRGLAVNWAVGLAYLLLFLLPALRNAQPRSAGRAGRVWIGVSVTKAHLDYPRELAWNDLALGQACVGKSRNAQI
jgi:hypothetical protein